MGTSFNSSFIPKENLSGGKPKKTKSLDLAMFISVSIFSLTVLFSIGVFLYKIYLQNSIEASVIMLKREENNFDVVSIENLTRLSGRIKVAEELLDKHIDLTGFFDFLEKNTLRNLQFTNLEFKEDEDGLRVFMKGVARNYSAIVLQSDIFGRSSNLKNPIFSNLTINKVGDVVFDFSCILSNNFILYKNRI